MYFVLVLKDSDSWLCLFALMTRQPSPGSLLNPQPSPRTLSDPFYYPIFSCNTDPGRGRGVIQDQMEDLFKLTSLPINFLKCNTSGVRKNEETNDIISKSRICCSVIVSIAMHMAKYRIEQQQLNGSVNLAKIWQPGAGKLGPLALWAKCKMWRVCQ